MKYKELSLEEIKDIYSGLDTNKKDKINQQYRTMYLAYRKLFTEYMTEKLNLQEYDKVIKESGLDFIGVNESDMDSYQYFSSNVLKYFYIRNNINIEKLDQKELEFLSQINFDNEKELEEEEKEFIEKTYQKVIFEDILKNGKKCIISYGPDSSRFFSSNDSIVVGMRYDEYAESGLDDEEWDELHEKQLDFLQELEKKMKLELKDKLDNPISIIQYNEFSVQRRNAPEPQNTEENDFDR